VRLIPPGSFTLNDSRGTFHNTAPDQVIAATRSWLGNSREAVADYEHQTDYPKLRGPDGKAKAAGWIKDWRITDGAVEARVEWTDTAAQEIKAKEYRYVSPVFDFDKSSRRVIRVKRFALTNDPAINDLPAIAATHQQQETHDVDSKLLAQALGLPDTSTDAELLASVGTLRQTNIAVVTASGLAAGASSDTIVAALRDKPDTSKWIAATEYQRVTGELATVTASLATFQKKASTDEIETVFAAALKEGKVLPAQKDYWVQVCSEKGNADPLKNFLKGAAVIVKPGEEPRKPGDPTTITAATLTQEQKDVCAAMGIKPEDFAKNLATIVAAGGHA
jgi:phage I-like protein